MPYGLKYHTEFLTREGKGFRIEIRKKSLDNDLSDEPIELADNPLVVEWPAVARFEPIMGSGITLKIWNTKVQGQLFFQDLFGTGELENRVDIIFEGFPYWTGFIVPTLYSDVLEERPRIIGVSAMDGLAILKNVNFSPQPGEITLFDVIISVLQLTGLELKIWMFCNLYPQFIDASFEGFPSFAFTIIAGDGLLLGNLDKSNAYSVLKEILKPFGCFIRQTILAGELVWQIDRWRMQNETRSFKVYNPDGSFEKDVLNHPPRVHVLFDEIPVIKGGSMVNQRGFKSMELTVDQKAYANLITPATSFLPTGLTAEFNYPDGTQVTPALRRWYVGTDGFGYVPSNEIVRDDQLFRWFAVLSPPIEPIAQFSIDGLETATKLTFSENFANEVLGIRITIDLAEQQLEAIITNPDDASKNIFCLIELEMTGINLGFSFRIIEHDPATGIIDGVFRLVDSNPNLANTQVRLIKEVLFTGDEDPTSLETQRITFNFEVPASVWAPVTDSDVYLEIRLLPFYNQTPFNDQVAPVGAIQMNPGIFIQEYTVKVTGLTQDNITEGEINSDFVEKYRNSFQFNDVPNFNFNNGFMRPQTFDPIKGGVLTKIWEEDFTGLGTSEFLPLIDRWLLDAMQAFHTARFELNVEARSDIITVSDLIDELKVTGKRYLITGLAFNAKWAVTKLSLIEFVKDDDVKIVE